MTRTGPDTPATSGTPPASVLPSPQEKHDFVRGMFDAIAPRYDLLNSLLSARMHHAWRRAAVKAASVAPGQIVLDVCTGTGDLAFELAKSVGPTGNVEATDFSAPMLNFGEEKRKRRAVPNVTFSLADTQNLPFASATFDAVTVGFGIRNVADIEKGIAEMARVTKPGGRIVLLEFNNPPNPVFAALYRFYSFKVMPAVGGLISGRRSAYEYLPSSVVRFHSREELTAMMKRAGLADIEVTDLMLGTVVIHRGVKPFAPQQKGREQ